MKKIILTILACALTTASWAQQAVDLGLSVKWATCNIGASSPEQYGDYFAWGEISPKAVYSWSTHKWWDSKMETHSSYHLTKYCSQNQYGQVDKKKVLDPEDDVAHVKLGGKWRIPTQEEWKELRKQCSWTWTKKNGVAGYLVKSIKNDNSIFLPAAGHHILNEASGVGSLGFYWASGLGTSYGSAAVSTAFGSAQAFERMMERSLGQSVRAVCDN